MSLTTHERLYLTMITFLLLWLLWQQRFQPAPRKARAHPRTVLFPYLEEVERIS